MSARLPRPYRQLYRVVETMPQARNLELHQHFSLVVVAPENADWVETALGLLAFGPLLVGIDWSDVTDLAANGTGLAHVVQGVTDTHCSLLDCLADLRRQGFDAGYLLVQLCSSRDMSPQTLHRLDSLATDLFAPIVTPVLFTAARAASCSQTVLIGFRAGEGRTDTRGARP